MSTLKLMQFSGEIPRLLPRLLPDGGAQRAENVRLDDGGLTPIRRKRPVFTVTGVTGPVKTIYKHQGDWLAWNTVVNAAPGPVAQDRLYYTGDGPPKMRVNGQVYNLKVPFPAAALTATATGTGTGDQITRLYVYTYVTEFGEESEPSMASNEVIFQSGNTITLSGFLAPPPGRAITKQRIYRSQTGQTAGTDFFFIAERTATADNFIDNIPVAQIGEVLPSRDWNQPPDTMYGLISLANGMMVALDGKDLLFSEPFRPHAWPEKYRLTLDYEGVALGSYGTTVVVATEGQPYIVSGATPETMQQERLELNYPCTNARGMVDLGYAVAYPSKDGLVTVSGGQAQVATAALMTRNDWLETSPETFVAGQYSGRYFASYEYLEPDGAPAVGTFIFDIGTGTPFILRASVRAEACFYDITESALYMLIGNLIYEWDALGEINEIMTWRSKQFVYPAPATFGCILVEGQGGQTKEEFAAMQAEQAAIQAKNALIFAQNFIGGEINGAAYNTNPVNDDELDRVEPLQFASVEIYADDKLIAAVSTLNDAVRLPSVQKARNWEVQVNGTASIDQITLATTMRELNDA